MKIYPKSFRPKWSFVKLIPCLEETAPAGFVSRLQLRAEIACLEERVRVSGSLTWVLRFHFVLPLSQIWHFEIPGTNFTSLRLQFYKFTTSILQVYNYNFSSLQPQFYEFTTTILVVYNYNFTSLQLQFNEFTTTALIWLCRILIFLF
jgi:hypothetical protein